MADPWAGQAKARFLTVLDREYGLVLHFSQGKGTRVIRSQQEEALNPLSALDTGNEKLNTHHTENILPTMPFQTPVSASLLLPAPIPHPGPSKMRLNVTQV